MKIVCYLLQSQLSFKDMRHYAIIGILCLFSSAAFAQAAVSQNVGILGGKAADQAKKPYADYQVQLRDVETGQRILSVPLNQDARFSFTGVPLTKKVLVELYQVKQNQIVCTAGPYTLSAPSLMSKTDININCGTNPAVYWLIVAGAGTAIAIALGVRSAKQ